MRLFWCFVEHIVRLIRPHTNTYASLLLFTSYFEYIYKCDGIQATRSMSDDIEFCSRERVSGYIAACAAAAVSIGGKTAVCVPDGHVCECVTCSVHEARSRIR